YEQHVQQYGPADNHPYAKRNDPSAGGCPLLGNQCPVKADLATDYSGDYGFPDYGVYMKENIAKSKLLTMEDIERRKQEDEMEYGDYSGGPPVPVPAASNSQDSGPQVGHMGVGLMTAIQKTPEPESNGSADSSFQPTRPPMGGLLAEIGKKKPKVEPETESGSPTKKKRGLLAAITGRGRKS
ncbi:MAG: hypothetical protein SGILL_007750, partial [Bacillariaceae sp.]